MSETMMDWLLPLASEQEDASHDLGHQHWTRAAIAGVSGFASSRDRKRRARQARVFTYHNCVLHTRSGAVICDGKFAPPTKHKRFDIFLPTLHEIIAHAQRRRVVLEPIVVAYHGGWNNYFHWTSQCLLNLYVLKTAGLLGGKIAVPSVQPFHVRSLEMLGIARDRIFPINRNIPLRAKTIVLTNLLSQPGAKIAPQELREMGLLFRSSISAAITRHDSAAIYISRLDSARRKMTNERLLVERLERLGVRHVQMTGMSLDEQIAAVMNAKVIIAPHGAGLTNVLYARSAAFVYELFPSDYRPDCYQQVAIACGLRYACDVFDTLKPGRHDLAWEVDIDTVLAKTESLLREAG